MMNNDQVYKDPVAERNNAKEIWIQRRTVEEQKFNNWYKKLLECPKEKVLDKIPFDYSSMSLQSMIPEWYEEVPDPAVAHNQIVALNEKISVINGIIRELNDEGLALLREYNAMYSGGR